MRVFIDEGDNDYGTITYRFERDLQTLQEAHEWCKSASWTGYSYDVDVELTNAVNDMVG